MSIDIMKNRLNELKNNCNKEFKSSGSNIDKKMVEKCWRHMDKLVKVCQEPRLLLKHSPPYILDIIPDIYKHMKLIQTTYDNKWLQLSSNLYFNKFINNLLFKVQLCTNIMTSTDLHIFDETSIARCEFTKLCLIFSHIFTELKALFPEGHYIGESYRVTKNDADSWWKKTFKDRTIVSWEDFNKQLLLIQPLSEINHDEDESKLIIDLKKTIDLTQNEHVSIFEFDVFTRLFQPWYSLVRNWYVLAVKHPGFGAFLTYDEVKAKLTEFKNKPGSYIYRLSCTRLGQWAIGYVTKDGNILQTIPLNKSLGQALLEGEKAKYYLYPNGKDKNQDIRMLAEAISNSHIAVTEEQYDIYCGMGSSFEQCKICAENDKDVRIEPCGHLMCTACLLHWQSNSGATCPFCRSVIKGTEPIVIDPYKTPKQSSPPLPVLPSNVQNQSTNGTSYNLPIDETVPPPPNPRGSTVPQVQKISNNLKVKTLSDSLGAVGGNRECLSPPEIPHRTNSPHLSPLVPRRIPPVPLKDINMRSSMIINFGNTDFSEFTEEKTQSLPDDAIRLTKDDNNIIYSLSRSIGDDPPPIPLRTRTMGLTGNRVSIDPQTFQTRSLPLTNVTDIAFPLTSLEASNELGFIDVNMKPIEDVEESKELETQLIDNTNTANVLAAEGYNDEEVKYALEMGGGKIEVAREFLISHKK